VRDLPGRGERNGGEDSRQKWGAGEGGGAGRGGVEDAWDSEDGGEREDGAGAEARALWGAGRGQ